MRCPYIVIIGNNLDSLSLSRAYTINTAVVYIIIVKAENWFLPGGRIANPLYLTLFTPGSSLEAAYSPHSNPTPTPL